MNWSIELLAWVGTRLRKPPGWERFVRLFASPEKFASVAELRVLRDGNLFLAQPALTLGWNVVMFGTYEPELRAIIRKVLPNGGVAVDVGANVGWHTLLMANQVGELGRVFAVEPNPSVRRRLENHLKLNGLSQVAVLAVALAAEDGSADFWGPGAGAPESGDGHLLANAGDSPGDVVRVQTRRLDSIAAEASIQRLDLIKIDVEGFEWDVLRGGEAALARFRPHIVFEFNEDYISRSACTSELLERFFARHRYQLSAIRRNRAVPIEPGRWPHNADVWAAPAG